MLITMAAGVLPSFVPAAHIVSTDIHEIICFVLGLFEKFENTFFKILIRFVA